MKRTCLRLFLRVLAKAQCGYHHSHDAEQVYAPRWTRAEPLLPGSVQTQPSNLTLNKGSWGGGVDREVVLKDGAHRVCVRGHHGVYMPTYMVCVAVAGGPLQSPTSTHRTVRFGTTLLTLLSRTAASAAGTVTPQPLLSTELDQQYQNKPNPQAAPGAAHTSWHHSTLPVLAGFFFFFNFNLFAGRATAAAE